jgi:hypothetical protein
MKYLSVLLLLVLTIMGAVTMTFLIRDVPQYAAGEPVAIIKDWLLKRAVPSSSLPTDISPENSQEDENEIMWTEEYLGKGKWLVSNAVIPSGYSESELTFEEWIAKTKGWDANRLKEYADDLSPEARESFQENMRTYTSGQPQSVDLINQWYVYERSGLIEKVEE